MCHANYLSHSYNGKLILIISQVVHFASEFPAKLSRKDSLSQMGRFLQKLPLKNNYNKKNLPFLALDSLFFTSLWIFSAIWLATGILTLLETKCKTGLSSPQDRQNLQRHPGFFSAEKHTRGIALHALQA